MTIFLTIILLILTALIIFSLFRFRVRLNLTQESKTIFVGVGNTGITTDLKLGTGSFSLAGFKFRPKPFKWKFKAPQAALKAIPKMVRAFWNYTFSILKCVTIEQLEGEINAGLGEPHLTGYAFGFYQAALAGIPGASQRFRFNPDWTGASFDGRFNAAVSIPIYRIIYRSIVLVFQLPFRELIKMAIGRKARLERSRKDRKQNVREK